MSIARQRREAAAALAILLEEKQTALDAACNAQDPEAAKTAAVELALVQQNNTKFLIYVLKYFAGTLLKLPGGHQPLHDFSKMQTHDSLVDAVQADNEYDESTKH